MQNLGIRIQKQSSKHKTSKGNPSAVQVNLTLFRANDMNEYENEKKRQQNLYHKKPWKLYNIFVSVRWTAHTIPHQTHSLIHENMCTLKMATNITRQLAGTFFSIQKTWLPFCSVNCDFVFFFFFFFFPFCLSLFFLAFRDYLLLLFVNFTVKNVTAELRCFDKYMDFYGFICGL